MTMPEQSVYAQIHHSICVLMLLFKRKFFLFLIYIIYLTNFLNLWILNITFLTADFKTVTKCQYRNVTVLTVMVLMYFQ